MDTKWKKFSRSLAVRVILNGLMIGCLLVEIMLCMSIVDIEREYENNYLYGHIDNLYGNTELQESFKNAWRGLMEYVIAIKSQGISLEKLEKQDVTLEEQLLIDAEQEKLIDASGEFQYQLTVKDGTDKTISNCIDNPDDLNVFPIYSLYKGYLNENTYIKDWTNYYVDSYTEKYEKDYGYDYVKDTEFQWLEINSIINEICQGNQEYSQYVAKKIVDNIQVYKESVKNCLYYFYDNNSNSTNEKIENSILKKLYGTGDNTSTEDSIEELISEICVEYDVDRDYLVYDMTAGLIFNNDSRVYYYKTEDDGIQCFDESTSPRTYNRFVKKMEEQKKEEKSQEPLTKEETNTLIETISKAIYIGDNGLSTKAQISIPIAAVLGTPEEYTMYIGVDDALYQTTQAAYMSEYAVSKEKADMIENQERNYIFVLIGVLVFLGFVVLALFYVCGRKEGTEEIQFLAIDSWYTEIQAIFIVLGIIVGIVCMAVIADAYSLFHPREDIFIALLVLAVTAFLLIELLCSIVRKVKGGILFHQSILGKLIVSEQGKLYHEKLSKRVMRFYLIMCGSWLFFEYIALSFSVYDNEHGLLIIMQLILVFLLVSIAIFLHRYLQHWEQIRDGVKRIKAGEINYQIPTNDSHKPLNLFAKDINSLSEGLESAVDEMLKSEKLKTELISNVSHDIKTPLTSIITYVDLIKKEDVQPEKVKEYINVLDQKSQRLKTLTDDLFEAAKATSGAMAMDITRIDLGSLVNQAIGEFSEKLEKSDLNVRNNIEGDSLFVMADGKLTWRIMENLLGNISKYALTGSRVYIDTTDTGNTILLMVKNISDTELNISAEELMERFTRGDQSRNTEGSGLGLNIAQSLATLQGGDFHVEIDGDLFKAILELPKAKTEIV